jgi:hypothetical protein
MHRNVPAEDQIQQGPLRKCLCLSCSFTLGRLVYTIVPTTCVLPLQTGFPCPAILQSGKPCPGYVCKMHVGGHLQGKEGLFAYQNPGPDSVRSFQVFFPSNQKKKQARLQAAIAAAVAPKPRPAPVKPAKVEGRAVAQVAISAMKRATSVGTYQDSNSAKVQHDIMLIFYSHALTSALLVLCLCSLAALCGAVCISEGAGR